MKMSDCAYSPHRQSCGDPRRDTYRRPCGHTGQQRWPFDGQYKKRPEGFDRLLSMGKVEIENEVEIGASCTIDRSVSATTRIGSEPRSITRYTSGTRRFNGRRPYCRPLRWALRCAASRTMTLGQVGVNSSVCIGEKGGGPRTGRANAGRKQNLFRHTFRRRPAKIPGNWPCPPQFAYRLGADLTSYSLRHEFPKKGDP